MKYHKKITVCILALITSLVYSQSQAQEKYKLPSGTVECGSGKFDVHADGTENIFGVVGLVRVAELHLIDKKKNFIIGIYRKDKDKKQEFMDGDLLKKIRDMGLKEEKGDEMHLFAEVKKAKDIGVFNTRWGVYWTMRNFEFGTVMEYFETHTNNAVWVVEIDYSPSNANPPPHEIWDILAKIKFHD